MNSSTDNSGECAVTPRRREVLAGMGLRPLRARRPLPGAAPSRSVAPPSLPHPELVRPDIAPDTRADTAQLPIAPALSVRSAVLPEVVSGAEVGTPAVEPTQLAAPTLRCRVLLATAGKTVWLEPMAPGASPDPRWTALLDNLLRAAGATESATEPEFFDWPLHDNPELDRSAPAATAALAALLARRHEADPVQHVVLLGAAEHRWMAETVPKEASCLATVSLHEVLEEGRLKARLRRDLAELFS